MQAAAAKAAPATIDVMKFAPTIMYPSIGSRPLLRNSQHD